MVLEHHQEVAIGSTNRFRDCKNAIVETVATGHRFGAHLTSGWALWHRAQHSTMLKRHLAWKRTLASANKTLQPLANMIILWEATVGDSMLVYSSWNYSNQHEFRLFGTHAITKLSSSNYHHNVYRHVTTKMPLPCVSDTAEFHFGDAWKATVGGR